MRRELPEPATRSVTFVPCVTGLAERRSLSLLALSSLPLSIHITQNRTEGLLERDGR